jgi:hypothetical protein
MPGLPTGRRFREMPEVDRLNDEGACFDAAGRIMVAESAVAAFAEGARTELETATVTRCRNVLLSGRITPALELTPKVFYNILILLNKIYQARRRALPSAAQRRGSDCVFFAQHLPEIGQTDL